MQLPPFPHFILPQADPLLVPQTLLASLFMSCLSLVLLRSDPLLPSLSLVSAQIAIIRPIRDIKAIIAKIIARTLDFFFRLLMSFRTASWLEVSFPFLEIVCMSVQQYAGGGLTGDLSSVCGPSEAMTVDCDWLSNVIQL